MIRTFLLYSIIDRCINAFFDKIDRAFLSVNKPAFNGILRVGASILRINIQHDMLSTYKRSELSIYEGCTITGVDHQLGSVEFMARRLFTVIEFGCAHYCRNFLIDHPLFKGRPDDPCIASRIDILDGNDIVHVPLSMISSVLHYP